MRNKPVFIELPSEVKYTGLSEMITIKNVDYNQTIYQNIVHWNFTWALYILGKNIYSTKF